MFKIAEGPKEVPVVGESVKFIRWARLGDDDDDVV